jgi:hypothetical protein
MAIEEERATLDQEISASVDTARVNMRLQDLPLLTRQELEFAAALAATSSDRDVAARKAGINERKARLWAKRPDILAHVAAILAPHQEHLARGVSYSIEDAHVDIEMGKRMAATAGEWFQGVALQMKLHGLGEKKAVPAVSVTINNVQNKAQLEQMDDEALLGLAGLSMSELLPEPIEGECEHVDNT